MLQPKQGTRVRISSHEKVINMSDVYIPSNSICSCIQCDSTCCFSYRNINSGLPCSCTDCDPKKCLTWEVKKDESKRNNKKRNYLSPEISKDSLSVPESKLKSSAIKSKKYTERPINATDEISFLNLDNDPQKDTFYDPELKEVFTIEEKPIENIETMDKLRQNKNMDGFEIKDSSSNENSEVIECSATHVEKKHSNHLETKLVSTKDGSGTKISSSKNKTLEIKNSYEQETQQSLTNYDINDFKNKEFYSKIKMPLPLNEFAYPDTKKSLTRKTRNCCSNKISTDNTKSDFSEVYEIYTNEKRNIVKYCKICKNLENKYDDTPENKQDKPENKIECKDSKDVQNNKSNLEINTKMKITNIKCNHEHPIKDKTSDIDSRNYTKYTYKDVSHTQNKINMNKNNKSYEKYVSHLQSVAISYARPDYENSRAELSAQIMNVPYENIKDSFSRKQSPTDSTINTSNKYDKMDIFSRLKEIYKACSCKVCECIADKSLFSRSEICNCRPCDCDDCQGYMAKLQKRIHYAPHSGCPCISCDRKDCRGIVRSGSYAACDYKPCDYLKCSESFSKPCTCAPCQCDTCKTSIFMPQMLTVANATESFRQNNCDCEPCECTNCTSRYSAMTSNLMRQVSTGTITYGNCNCEECLNNSCQLGRSDCRCDSQHKVIRKPIAEKKPDYDIHRVYIKKDKYEKKTITNNNRNTIAMYALSNNHPQRLFNYSNKKRGCECDVCECIVCKDKGKGSMTNKSIKIVIDNPSRNFNGNILCRTERSPCACQSCKSLQAENDACNCTNSNHMGFNFKIINNYGNYNFKRGKPTYSTLKKKCMCKLRDCPECNHRVDVPSQNFLDTDDDDKLYLLKKGMLLTPSMFEKNELASDSSHIHIKPEKYSLRGNDLRKKILTNEQNSKLCRNKSCHSCLCHDDNDYITNESPKSDIKVISTNTLFMTMASKEVGTNEIYKTSSVDFKKGNVSTVFSEHSKSNVQNDGSNTILLDAGLTHITPKQSSHCNNKQLEYNKDLNKCNQIPSLDKQEVEDLLFKTKSSSNNVHFSSSKSMSLVKLLCNEKNLNIDYTNSRNFLQSLEIIPLKRLKMYEENDSYTWDKTLNEGNILDYSAKDNYSINNNLLSNMDHDKLDTLDCEKKKLMTGLIEDNYDIHDKNIVKEPVLETIKQIKPQGKSDLQIVVRKPKNYNINIKDKESADQTKTKSRSKSKVANNNMKNKIENPSKDIVHEVNTKRNLEIPEVINSATSAVNFNEFDRPIDFEKSFKLFREVNFSNGENKKPSPVLRKNFFFSSDVSGNKGISSSIPMPELDVNNDEKSTSFQKSTIFPYGTGTGFGNKALTKLQKEINELLYSPLLQTNFIQTEESRSKNILNSVFYMTDATSQTKRKTIMVDKEINCNMLESRETSRQSIQNFINTTLTDVVQHTNIEMKEQNLIRDFNKAVKSSVGELKANFVGFKKISDHSVLLKWAMPQDLSNVQGYEIDGRPVKKILNPSRCMAVLKCLPHSEKLLLTIRTITNLQSFRSPVTTIVYNPKKNKTIL